MARVWPTFGRRFRVMTIKRSLHMGQRFSVSAHREMQEKQNLGGGEGE